MKKFIIIFTFIIFPFLPSCILAQSPNFPLVAPDIKSGGRNVFIALEPATASAVFNSSMKVDEIANLLIKEIKTTTARVEKIQGKISSRLGKIKLSSSSKENSVQLEKLSAQDKETTDLIKKAKNEIGYLDNFMSAIKGENKIEGNYESYKRQITVIADLLKKIIDEEKNQIYEMEKINTIRISSPS